MDPRDDALAAITRRHFFGRAALGAGTAALASLLDKTRPCSAAEDRARSGLPHFPAKARRVICLFQNGGPSHVELFDYKPMLRKWHGREIPSEIQGGRALSTMTSEQTSKPVLAEVTKFAQHGAGGAWVSDYLPHTARVADELCFVKSVQTDTVNHAPATTLFLTGAEQAGRPSMGAWLTYGLGSETQQLPAFVAMTSRDPAVSCGQLPYDYYWGSGFLPSKYQGVQFRGSGDPVLYLSNPDGVSRQMRRGMLDDLARLNTMKLADYGDPEIATRIAQYEMAYRMQTSVPELTDLADEPEHVLALYGPEVRIEGSYAYNCLMARRLAERGVRFIQLMHSGWDQHASLKDRLKNQCDDTDQPSAGLIEDLKQRGLLDDTVVLWGGEFGRTPFLQGKIEDVAAWGRDHHPYAFTIWMAGGGIRPGMSFGASDDFGYNVAEHPVHVHDVQATILHLLGIDHERLTYKFQGRNFRLTDVHGHVVNAILA